MKKMILSLLVIAAFGCKKEETPTAATPVAIAASDIFNNSFQANWNAAANATEYELQTATEVTFVNVTTQTNLGGPTVVSGLSGNTEYFYRVRATNLGQNPSSFSNTISTITLPDAPVAAAATDIKKTSFQANWQPVTGVNDYLLYVSKDNFTSNPPEYITGYEGIVVTGTTHEVNGLEAGKFYYYRLESKVGTRISEPSNSEMVQTLF